MPKTIKRKRDAGPAYTSIDLAPVLLYEQAKAHPLLAPQSPLPPSTPFGKKSRGRVITATLTMLHFDAACLLATWRERPHMPM